MCSRHSETSSKGEQTGLSMCQATLQLVHRLENFHQQFEHPHVVEEAQGSEVIKTSLGQTSIRTLIF